MKLKSLFLQLFFLCVNSQKCFINNDIVNSNNLFTYIGNVYDITNYNHPGGEKTLQRTVGTSLETFVNMQKYDFHLTSNKFKSDLNQMIVGVLKPTCVTIPPPTIAPTTLAPPTIAPTTLDPPTIAPTTLDPPTIAPTTLDPPTIAPTTLAPPTIAPTTLAPPTITPTLPQNITHCKNQNLNLNIPYTEQNLIGDYNINNIIQDPNFIQFSLLQFIGGVRISTTNFFHYGQFDITMKTPKGLNVITSFYIKSEDGYIINFNIINKDNNALSIIDTNIYNLNLNDVNINSIEYPQPVVVTETFNKYSLIWTPSYYEWRINDVMLRRSNKNEINYFPDFQSKIYLSLWEAPSSVWAGPGINWQNAPFMIIVSKFDITCYNPNINNSTTNNSTINNNSNSTNSEYDPMINTSSSILTNYNYLALFSIIFSAFLYN